MNRYARILLPGLIALTAAVHAAAAPQNAVGGKPPKRDWSARFVYPDGNGRLIYDRTARGDQLPDFSHCGYGGGGTSLPDVAAVHFVSPGDGDDTQRIQAAIDSTACRPVDAQGFRGAVQLRPGTYEITGSLIIRCDGIVLRGSGSPQSETHERTTLAAVGTGRGSLIRIEGRHSPILNDREATAVTDEYVPCGASEIQVARESAFAVGDLVCIEHPGSMEWISALGMNQFPTRDSGSWLDWRPNTINIRWLRSVRQVQGRTLTLDAPLTSSIDAALTQAVVRPCDASQLIRNVGVENLCCVSQAVHPEPHALKTGASGHGDLTNGSKDEDHAWTGISVNHVQDGWVRAVDFRGFCGSAVSVLDDCRRVTVADCRSREPISELAGWRRHTWFTNGSQTLFLRCTAEDGRHDFCVGHAAAGPNAFSFCDALRATEFSGPIGSWASGVLYDNCTIDGAAIALTSRETAAQGTGWSAANCVVWNCVAPAIICRMPPTAQNWAIGVWGEVTGDGHWRQLNEFAEPDSLLVAQLHERTGADGVRSLDQRPVTSAGEDLPLVGSAPPEAPQEPPRRLTLVDGRLLIEGQLATGQRIGTQWWRGSVLPDRRDEFGKGITRFVPGRDGRGFTDDLNELTDEMQREGVIAIEHHWGLWYDRRRDDHLLVRRMDGAVWPPFYEQPWARSGIGTAWDGLSRYDLTRFNPWYFARLQEFAAHCDQKGLILIQQMYFQHNLLESGAHWADFPWRPVNCLQNTGFPEPPPLENRKRVFLASDFWDLRNPVRRELHRQYIRHCLDQLGQHRNVIFSTGEEYTGPTEFMAFWLETIAAWQRENNRDVLVSLSCTRDVQDAVLRHPSLEPVIDIIDLKYWWYTPGGTAFAPPGGTNLAPRQQLREFRGNVKRSAETIARAITEYRRRHPTKAVICGFPEATAEAVIEAGGSLPETDNVRSEREDGRRPDEGTCWSFQ